MGDTPKPSAVEEIKKASPHLRGPIQEEWANGVPTFTEASRQLLQVHGIYPQEDHGVRRARKEARHI